MHCKWLHNAFEQGLGGNKIARLMKRRLAQCFEGNY